jgi:hypothetical protein
VRHGGENKRPFSEICQRYQAAALSRREIKRGGLVDFLVDILLGRGTMRVGFHLLGDLPVKYGTPPPGPSFRRMGMSLLMGLIAGCGEAEPLVYPVQGLVTVDGHSIHADIATINLVPDKDKGNTTTLLPTGYLNKEGAYTVYYAKGKKGAPPGWYKVQIVASQLGEGPPISTPRPEGAPPAPPPPPPLFDSKFTRAENSGLVFEVVKNPAPGAYDLKLTK